MNNLHSKRISIQALLSLIFYFINIPFLEYIDVLPEFLFIIPIAEIIFFLVLVIKERKEFETKKPKFRLVILIISLVFLALSLLLLKDDPEYSLLEISASIVIFLMYSNMIINFISAIIVYKFEQEVYKQSQQIDELDGVENVEISHVTAVIDRVDILYDGVPSEDYTPEYHIYDEVIQLCYRPLGIEEWERVQIFKNEAGGAESRFGLYNPEPESIYEVCFAVFAGSDRTEGHYSEIVKINVKP